MVKRIVIIGMFGVMILMNYLANSLPLNNKTTGELSGLYPNLFVPAGITFSIWGIIYLLLFVIIILYFRKTISPGLDSIGWAFAISSLLNGLWIVAWHYEILTLSVLIMLGILISLIYIGLKIVPISYGIVKAAFGVYLGWICIATIANITALLVGYQWGGWGISHQVWAIILIIIGLLITGFTQFRLRNPFIGLAVIWAFTGIVIQQVGVNYSIVITASISIAIMAILTFWLFMNQTPIKSGFH